MRLNSVTLWAGIAVAIWTIVLDRSPGASEVNNLSAGDASLLIAESSATARNDNRCPNIVGQWQSWASFLFGQADTTFNSDGTAVHRSGITATWKCQGDKILMSWGGETPKLFTLQGNKLINPQGIVGFSRAQAPPSPPENAAPPERRQAAAPQVSTPAKPTPARPTGDSIDNTSFYPRAAVYGTERIDFGPDSDADSDIDVCSNGSGERAIAACTRIIDDPDWSIASRSLYLIDRGEHYGVQGRYDLAIKDFDKAIQAFPTSGVIYNSRGLTYGMKGDYDRAIRDFAQAIELIPDFAAAYYNRAQTYVGKYAYDLALKDFAQAIALNPKFTLAYDKRGYVYFAKKDYGRAIADYTEAIHLSPDYAAAYNRRGTAYAMQGDYSHALGDYSTAIDLQPDSADFHYFRAALVALRGHGDEVIADLDEAIRLAPQRAEFYLLRGNAWIGKSDDDRARSDFDQATALDPKNEANVAAFAWSLKGQLEYLRGDPARATQDYDEAVRLAPRSASFYSARGTSWDARGEHNRAIRDYTQALTLQPDAKAARLARGLAYFALGEFGRAAEDFAPLKQDAADLHGALWYYLAQARTGSNKSRDDLARAAARRKPNMWPSPIFQLFLGQRDVRSVEAAATSPQQRCEAQFYASEWHLLQGASQGARPAAEQALNAATKICARTSIEYQAAVEELRRLSRQEGALIRP